MGARLAAVSIVLLLCSVPPALPLMCYLLADPAGFSDAGNATGGRITIVMCRANVTECFTYVCTGSVYFTLRGCLDPRNSTMNCQAVRSRCEGLGGVGHCHRCGFDTCNG